MVSFADSALKRAASLRKLIWDSQKDTVAWSGTMLEFKHLCSSKREIYKFYLPVDIYMLYQSSSLVQSK